MNENPTPNLEGQLRDLTTWGGPAPGLWRRAANAADARRKSSVPGVLRRPIPLWFTSGLAAAVILVVVGSWMTTRERNRGVLHGLARTTAFDAAGQDEDGGEATLATPALAPAKSLAAYRDIGLQTGGMGGGGRMAPSAGGRSRYTDIGQPPPFTATRHVVRKATIELVTGDVRAAFLKASLLISEAGGEYVQDSALTGTEDHLEANLTLRVAAERLADVLNELRGLGEVRSERSGGEDVTTQVVDLEARLRNEQRVETELLELLERRQDAPLKEILELRRAIADVRQSIELLAARRQQLDRLVSLATVLVIIRPADTPEPVAEGAGLGAYLAESLGHAWEKGLTFLVDTLAGLLSILVGGLIWWLLLLAGVLLLLRRHRLRTP